MAFRPGRSWIAAVGSAFASGEGRAGREGGELLRDQVVDGAGRDGIDAVEANRDAGRQLGV